MPLGYTMLVVHIRHQVTYNQSALIGGTGGHSFDDFLALNGSSRIKKIVVRYEASIDGIQVTYWEHRQTSLQIMELSIGKLLNYSSSVMVLLT